MRKFIFALVAIGAILGAGVVAMKSEAAVFAGAATVGTVVKTESSVRPATCYGWGDHCPPGYYWTGHRCRPC